MPDEAFAAM
jgi:hypothetical protein